VRDGCEDDIGDEDHLVFPVHLDPCNEGKNVAEINASTIGSVHRFFPFIFLVSDHFHIESLGCLIPCMYTLQ